MVRDGGGAEEIGRKNYFLDALRTGLVYSGGRLYNSLYRSVREETTGVNIYEYSPIFHCGKVSLFWRI